jgi:hypothetical protein
LSVLHRAEAAIAAFFLLVFHKETEDMSDPLASSSTLEATPQDGQSQQASDVQPQGTSDGQPPQDGQVVKVEDFKNLQRKLTEKDLDSKRALAEAQQARAYAQQLEQRFRQLEDNAAPDDYTRLELRAKRAEETAQQYAQRLAAYEQAQQAERAKFEALDRIAERYSVTREDLLKATDYESAVELAIETRDKRKQRKQQQDDDKSRRNMPDIGSGAPRTADSEWERKYAEARERRDTTEQMRLLQQREK